MRVVAGAALWQIWSRSGSKAIDSQYQRGVQLMEAAQLQEAVSTFSDIIKKQPTFAEAWNKRATLEFVLGNYDASLADIDKVLDLEPRHFGALAGRGMILQSQQKWGAALDAYRDALRMNPNMPGVKNAVHELEKRERDI